MSRYLTPSKIAILCLAYIYTEGVVATADTTAVLSFLIPHVLPDTPNSTSATASRGVSIDSTHVIPIVRFENVLSKLSSAVPGRTIWDQFLKRLWALNCSDFLDAFMHEILFLLTKSREQVLRERESGEEPQTGHGRVSRTSPLGACIRRCHLEYTRLQFQDSITLWQDFIAYRATTRNAYERKNAPDGKNALDLHLTDLRIDSSHPMSQIMYGRLAREEDASNGFSTYDVEKLMEHQVSELQRVGGRLPEEMRAKMAYLAQTGATLPSLANYLRFLDSWRAGDYSSAFENLHRYFDYTMHNKDRTFYQYALLNLAILQADFGCHSEAIPAMQEAIATARENKDTACLNFCMSWLYHFGKTFPAEMKELRESGILGSESEGLAFLKTRAKDAEMWSLLSTCLLSEAKLGLQDGDSLAIILENIAKAAHLNVTKGVSNVSGPTLLMRGSVYGRMGLAHLAWLAGESFLECYLDDAPAEDVLKCTCRMASLLVQQGRYSPAMKLMEDTPKQVLCVLKYSQYWTFYASLLKLRTYLHRHDVNAAMQMLQRLKGQGAPDVEVALTLSLLEIDMLIRRGTFDQAIDLAEKVAASQHHETSDVMAQIKLLNIKARCLALCKHPLKGFTITIRAANLAYRARILPALWESCGILANILIELKEYSAAVGLLVAIIPQVLECSDCDLAARTFSYLVDAHMGLAGTQEAQSTKRKEHMSKAMEYIDCALVQFRYVEDLNGQTNMLAKKATIMHFRGDPVLANDVASQYLELRKTYQAARVI